MTWGSQEPCRDKRCSCMVLHDIRCIVLHHIWGKEIWRYRKARVIDWVLRWSKRHACTCASNENRLTLLRWISIHAQYARKKVSTLRTYGLKHKIERLLLWRKANFRGHMSFLSLSTLFGGNQALSLNKEHKETTNPRTYGYSKCACQSHNNYTRASTWFRDVRPAHSDWNKADRDRQKNHINLKINWFLMNYIHT